MSEGNQIKCRLAKSFSAQNLNSLKSLFDKHEADIYVNQCGLHCEIMCLIYSRNKIIKTALFRGLLPTNIFMSMGNREYVSESCINEFNGTAAITTSDVKHESLRLHTLSTLHERNQFHKFTANAIKCFLGSQKPKQHDNLWIFMDHET